jgi:hypothetical protein
MATQRLLEEGRVDAYCDLGLRLPLRRWNRRLIQRHGLEQQISALESWGRRFRARAYALRVTL